MDGRGAVVGHGAIVPKCSAGTRTLKRKVVCDLRGLWVCAKCPLVPDFNPTSILDP